MLQYHMPGAEPPKQPEDRPHFHVYAIHCHSAGSRMGDPGTSVVVSPYFETEAQAEIAIDELRTRDRFGSMASYKVTKLKVYRA